MLLQGGVKYNDILNNNAGGVSQGAGSSGFSNSLSGGVSMSGSSSNGAGSSLGSGGMVQGGNAPGIWGEIKKEVDARKAGLSNALENYADNTGNIALAANSFRSNFMPSMAQIAPLQQTQSNLYNYLVR